MNPIANLLWQSIIFRMRGELASQTPLNSAEEVFLEWCEGEMSGADRNNLRATLLMNNEQRLGRINDLMERIDLYKVDPSKASLRVKTAWRLLDDFLGSKAEYLRENGLTPVIYGSVTFDDPETLDFDICLLAANDDEKVKKVLKERWEKELSATWKEIRPGVRVDIGTDGHIDYMSFERLEQYTNALKENQLDYVDEDENGFDMFVYFMEASSILAGEYRYCGQEEESKFKEKFLELVQQSPALSAYTIWNLEQTLIRRETRRAGVADHQTGADAYTTPKIEF